MVRWPADVLSHFGRVNSFGLMMILDTSPSPDWLMMVVNSSWVILPNPLGIHNAGYSYAWGPVSCFSLVIEIVLVYVVHVKCVFNFMYLLFLLYFV